MDEVDRKLKEYHEKQNQRTLRVEIDTKAMEEMMTRLKKAEDERDLFKNQLTDVAEKLLEKKRIKLGAPDTITTPDELLEWQINQENSREDDLEKRGGVGQIPLTDAQTGGGKGREYDSVESMIDDLRNRSANGDKNAKLILAQLVLKTWRGRKEQPHMLEAEHKGRIDPLTGQEEGIIEKMNRDYRKRLQMQRDEQ